LDCYPQIQASKHKKKVSYQVNPIGSEAELPDFLPNNLQEAHPAFLKAVPDEPAVVAVFPTGHTALDHQIHNFHRWAEKKLHTPIGQYMQFAQLGLVDHADPQRITENNQTLSLFKQTFSSFFWTGIECSNPESPKGERWDQLALTGIYQKKHRQKQIQLMQEAGIENVRLGLPNHKIVEEKNWRCFTSILDDFKLAGIKVSLDLQHFGLPSSFRNDQNQEESVYLNPQWPNHYVQFAMKAVKKYLPKLEALTLINEPMITNRFSACFWNEAMPGSMTDDRYNHFFIKRSLLIATAAVKARYEIERFLKTQQKDRIIFIHNESCEHHADNPEFNDFGRFLASDLILGHKWLLTGDFTQTDIFRWMETHFNKADHTGLENKAKNTQILIQQIAKIKALHEQFEQEFGKTMKADTVFGVDYYAACETVKLTTGFPKPTGVDAYTEEVETSQRYGLAGICIEYWNRYQLPILHTETNFVDHGENTHVGTSDDWGTKQLIELAQLPKFGVPILGFTWYSLMDQFNWHNGMQGSPQDTRLHPVGLFSWPEYQPRPFASHVLPSLLQALRHQPHSSTHH
jgi:beta-glucosidase/6-phospho-beta-glucosidase/beta-galactosidase